MKEKIEKLEEIRSKISDLDPRLKSFPERLKDLSQEALSYCEEVDDQQEVNWLKKALRTAEATSNDFEISKQSLEERQAGLSYLSEAIDSILIREKRYQ